MAGVGAADVRVQLRRQGVKVAKWHRRTADAGHGTGEHKAQKILSYPPSVTKARCPLDKSNQEFRVSRPNAVWESNFTYVHNWTGFVYVAFVIDAFARRIVDWKVSTSATAGFVLDALEKAIHARRHGPEDGLIHHSDRGVQTWP